MTASCRAISSVFQTTPAVYSGHSENQFVLRGSCLREQSETAALSSSAGPQDTKARRELNWNPLTPALALRLRAVLETIVSLAAVPESAGIP